MHRALAINASLTAVDLHGNDLRVEGTKALAPAIAASASLTEVDMRGNNNTDAASQLSCAMVEFGYSN